jgi:Peptidase family M28
MAAFGFTTRTDSFSDSIPGRGRVRLRNLSVTIPGRSSQTIVVAAHRDNATEAGAVRRDNTSGQAALVELARAYTGVQAGGVRPQHTIVFLSTDGGAFGGLGAYHFVHRTPDARRVVAMVNLDTIATKSNPRLELSGPGPHSPSFSLLGTTAGRISDQTRRPPDRTSAIGQLVDLGFPLSMYGQWPFLGRKISAITVTTAGDRPSLDGSVPEPLDPERLGQVGRATQALVTSLDQGLELSQGTSSYLYLGDRIIRGWTLALVLAALVVPFAAAAVDLFARCRRRHIALGPAFRAYRRRLLFWLWAGALFELFELLGAWPSGAPVPPDPGSSAAGNWPKLALTGFVILVGLSWLVSRGRLVPTKPATTEEELAGQTAALLVLALIALLVIATNAFALLFLLPSLHAWLWLPQVRDKRTFVRLTVFAAGLLGPALLLGSLAKRFGLGLDAPWYLVELTAIGYVPIVAVALSLAWIAVGAQLLVVSTGRYAPYPGAAQGAPPGFVRTTVRTIVLGVRSRRRRATARTY